jgi:hypothetical protein
MRVFSRLALTALAVLAVGALAFAGEKSVVQGKVTAVSDRAVTLTDDGGVEWTLEVARDTRVLAPGASHKSQALVASGRKATMDEFVREGHYVRVVYREQDGARYIMKLRVL